MSWPHRISFAALLALIVAVGPRSFELATTGDDLPRIEREREQLTQKNDALREEIRLLRAEVEALQKDPREIARIARQDLNLAAPHDIVFEVEGGTQP